MMINISLKSILILLLLIVLCNTSYSRKTNFTTADTLTQQEITILEEGVMNSTFGAVYYADSFSRVKDKMNASKFFMKIDPYYFLWAYSNLDEIDKIYTNFYLTDSAKHHYRIIYNQALNAEKPSDYLQFKQYHAEDQLTRKIAEKCADSSTCKLAARNLYKKDSLHFEYLYNYTQEHGWPEIKDGGLFAALLAIHDGDRADYYIPIIKNAIKNGQLPLDPLKLILAKKDEIRSYKDLRTKLDTSFKRTFLVDELRRHTVPINVEGIGQVLSKYCDRYLELFLVYEYQLGTTSYTSWFNEKGIPTYSHNHKHIELFYKKLEPYCQELMKNKLVHIYYLPVARKSDRIVLHVIIN